MDGRYFTFIPVVLLIDMYVLYAKLTGLKTACANIDMGKNDGETCVFITGDFILMEGSVVNTPADDLSQIIHMELTDKEGSSEITDYLKRRTRTLTDSIYD